jgi:hypothetical protein
MLSYWLICRGKVKWGARFGKTARGGRQKGVISADHQPNFASVPTVHRNALAQNPCNTKFSGYRRTPSASALKYSGKVRLLRAIIGEEVDLAIYRILYTRALVQYAGGEIVPYFPFLGYLLCTHPLTLGSSLSPVGAWRPSLGMSTSRFGVLLSLLGMSPSHLAL